MALRKARAALTPGAGGGTGGGVAIRFARGGARLALADIRPEALQETAALLKDAGAEFECYSADVAVTNGVENIFADTLSRFGRLDVCVNNAGIGNPPAPLHMMTDEGFDRTIAVNLRGVFLCMRAAAQQIVKQGGGRYISLSSPAGETGFQLLGPYCATKAGVILMTQVMAKELGPHKITVNCVCPGTIDTPLLRDTLDPILAASGQTLEDWALKNGPPIPLGRIGYPADVAKLVTYLASDEADYMTGQAINISGGQEMH